MISWFRSTRKEFATLALRVAITSLVFHVVAQWPLEGRASAQPKTLVTGATTAVRSGTDVLDLAAALTLHRTARTVFVDVRAADAWGRGRIKGAINLPLARLQADASAHDRTELRGAVNVVVYCDRSGCGAGPLAASLLRRKLDGRVSLYGGGWEQWTALGLPYDHD